MTSPADSTSPTSDDPDGGGAARRRAVLGVVRAADQPIGIAQVAQQLQVHPNTVRAHLKGLQRDGLVEPVGRSTTGAEPVVGRPAQYFRAVRVRDPGGPTHYRDLAQALLADAAADQHPTERGLRVGRAWGHHLLHNQATPAPERQRTQAQNPQAGPLGWAVAVLQELGCDPEPVPGTAGLVRLRHCPFLDAARTWPTVVCSVHLGLIQATLADGEPPGTVTSWQPFGEPDACLVGISTVPRTETR